MVRHFCLSILLGLWMATGGALAATVEPRIVAPDVIISLDANGFFVLSTTPPELVPDVPSVPELTSLSFVGTASPAMTGLSVFAGLEQILFAESDRFVTFTADGFSAVLDVVVDETGLFGPRVRVSVDVGDPLSATSASLFSGFSVADDAGLFSGSLTVTSAGTGVIPLPAGGVLLVTGLAGLGALGRRRRAEAA